MGEEGIRRAHEGRHVSVMSVHGGIFLPDGMQKFFLFFHL